MSKWKYFTEDELKCSHTGKCEMDDEFMMKLTELRQAVDKPFIITSAYRDLTHPIEAAKKTPGAHTTGKAVDILLRGTDAYRTIILAAAFGMTGIGVKQHGETRFIHVDCLENTDERPRPWVWSYK
jgi:zinc D-Ala-D-Ala carboxypeptidase|tara:strand:+ start:299 stop:676 length:378 start_codon:yes stop_codon:yes gene_type:complete